MKKTYYIAKVNINGNLFNLDKFDKIKNELIPKLFLNFQHNTNTYNDGKYEWTITNVEENGNVISGVLDKTCNENGYEVVETKTKSKVNENTQISDFFYFINEEYLVFNSNTNIDYQQFLKLILKVLKNGCQNDSLYLEIGDLEINLLTEKAKFEKELRENKVFSFQLDYIAPNDPRTGKNWLDLFQGIGSKKGQFKSSNKDEGLKLTKKDGTFQKIIKDSLIFAHRGWGDITAKIKNHTTGKTRTITTNEYPVKLKINNDDDITNKINQKVANVLEERKN